MNEQKLLKYSDKALSAALLIAATVLVIIALWRNHPVFKAITLAWIVLP